MAEKIYIDDSVLRRKIQKALNGLDREAQGKLLSNLARTAQGDIEGHFDDEQGPGGKWQKSKAATFRSRTKRKRKPSRYPDKTLSDVGDLRKIEININGSEAKVGTTVLYGAIHNFGGRTGRKHSVDMPQREWLYISGEGKRKMHYVVDDRIGVIFGKAGFKRK